MRETDIFVLEKQFEKLRVLVRDMLREELPTTAAQMIMYQGKLASHEVALSDLKLSMALAVATYRRDLGEDVRGNCQSEGDLGKLKKHVLDVIKLEGHSLDLSYRIEVLEAFIESISEIKWSCVERRRLSSHYLNTIGSEI
jgi:hypothetical protein